MSDHLGFGLIVDALVDHARKMSRVQTARTELRYSRIACGSCRHWMTDACPRETHVRGRRRGPSMVDSVCEKFVEQDHSRDLRLKREAELAEALKAVSDV